MSPRPEPLDETFLQFCQTDRQREYVESVIRHSSVIEAVRELGIDERYVRKVLADVRKRAAEKGHAPGHWNDGTAPGYRMGKVTVQRGPGGVERVWERQHPEGQRLEDIIARCDERLQDFPRFPAIAPPPATNASLTNFLGLFDMHIGEKISSDDPAGRWDVATAKRTIMASAANAIERAPKAQRIVVCFGGDAAHYDGLSPVTPRSKHVLHSDGDFDDMVDAVLDVAVYVIDAALKSHREVHVIWAEGNHDLASSVFMRKMLARIYSGEPRLSVVQSKVPYYALRFGKVMICVHHGHGAKLTDLAGVFASMFRPMWGEAEYAYAHAGHQHHIHEKERGGLLATQHPSLAPSDDYALGKGLISRRGCLLVTYHDAYGEVARTTTRPEMLGVFDAAA
ncbi:MAG: hypothetical protein ACK4FB_08240 [Brevundimonas sp.]|uniref:hypothetical protein n=1 Tax=Brevundimonas sp. TaxID=1871086 RepID=UPI003918C96C